MQKRKKVTYIGTTRPLPGTFDVKKSTSWCFKAPAGAFCYSTFLCVHQSFCKGYRDQNDFILNAMQWMQ